MLGTTRRGCVEEQVLEIAIAQAVESILSVAFCGASGRRAEPRWQGRSPAPQPSITMRVPGVCGLVCKKGTCDVSRGDRSQTNAPHDACPYFKNAAIFSFRNFASAGLLAAPAV